MRQFKDIRLRSCFVVSLLLVIGFAVRIYAAVCFQYSINSDIGINALMVRHIALGRHFPFFFYGQSYMGTIEAWLAAPFYLAMGHGMLPVLLGSAVTAAFSQWFLYRWVRDIAGKSAAVTALALYVFGSPALFYYNIFLGYPALLLFGLICCSLSVRVFRGEDDISSPWPAVIRVFVLGLSAGIGWWCNNMIVVFFPACLLVLFAGSRLKRLPLMGLAGAAGFVIGGSPWICQALTDPAALVFLRQGSSVDISQTASAVLRYSSEALGFSHQTFLWTVIYLAVGMFAFALYAAACVLCRKKRQLTFYLMPLIIIVTNAAVCLRSSHFSHVPASRYMLPMLPAVFAICGIASSYLIRSRIGRAGWAIPAVLLICQWYAFPLLNPLEEGRKVSSGFAYENKIEDFCRKNHIAVLRGGFRNHWINFASEERLTVCTYPDYDRYRPYRSTAFTDDNPAVIDDFMNFSGFLARTGASADRYRTELFRLHINAGQREAAAEYVPVEHIVCSEAGLVDRDVSTPGIISENHIKPRHGVLDVTVSFDHPVSLIGIRALGYNAGRARIESISLAGDGVTNVVYRENCPDNWFWSGPRPYGAGPLNCMEYRFSRQKAASVKLAVPFDDRSQLAVTELLFITSGMPPPDYRHDLAQLLQALDNMPIKKLYGSRWITEQVNLRMPQIKTIIPNEFYRQYDGVDKCRFDENEIINEAGSLIVSEKLDALRTRETLRTAGFSFEEIAVAQWQIFRIADKCSVPQHTRPVLWTEYGPFFYRTAPVGACAEVPDDAEVYNIRFANGIILEALKTRTLAGGKTEMCWYWRIPAGVDTADLAVFVHFKQKDGGIMFQDDRALLPQVPRNGLPLKSGSQLFEEKRIIDRSCLVNKNTGILFGIYCVSTGERLKSESRYKTSKCRIFLPHAIDLGR